MRSVHPSMRASVCHAHVNTSRVEARPIPGRTDRAAIGLRSDLPDADSLRQSEQAWTKWAGSLHISHMHRVVNVYNVSDRPMCLFRKTFKVIISEQRCGDSTVNVEERSGSSRLLRTVSPERIA